jgi:cytochrome b6-f complex iron-sulfur subunit
MTPNDKQSTAPVAAAAGPAAPPSPAAAKGKAESQTVSRREFNWLAVAWTAFTAASIAGLTATMRFMFPNVLFEPPTVFKAGFPDSYKPGDVDERYKEKYGVWVVRTEENTIYVLSTVCTHLGCPPNWLPAEQKFKCPCHGSGYYKSGINFEGPTPRPLERFRVTLGDDGQLIVDKNRKFQYEKGEWKDPESFLKL